MPSQNSITFCLIVVSLSLLWNWWKSTTQARIDNNFAAKHGCQPIKTVFRGKLPLGLDLVKELWDATVKQHLNEVLQPYIDDLGPNLELRILGNVGFVTIDPENIKTILSKSEFRDGELDFGLGGRRPALLPFFGDGIFTQDGLAWKHSREMLRKQFARIQYHNLEIFTEHVELLISRLSTSKGAVVDVQPLFFNFTLDTSTTLLFGDSAGSLQEGDKDDFGSNLNEASWFSAIRVELAYLYWLCSPPRYFRACEKVKKYTDKWVKKALDEKNESYGSKDQYAFINSLYDDLKDREKVREQLVNVLLAGRDSTAALLSWTFRLLIRHESVLVRLREEVETVLGDDIEITKEKLQKMPYLKNVLKETLRLYPPVPINFREAKNTTILPRGGGADGSSPILLRKNMGLGYAPYYMHRRKDLYGDDAFSFRPERWEDGSLQERIGWGYLPFNGGPRVCLGQEFALLEASYVVVRIIQSFPHLALPSDEEVVPIGSERQTITLVMAPTDGCRVQLGKSSL